MSWKDLPKTWKVCLCFALGLMFLYGTISENMQRERERHSKAIEIARRLNIPVDKYESILRESNSVGLSDTETNALLLVLKKGSDEQNKRQDLLRELIDTRRPTP